MNRTMSPFAAHDRVWGIQRVTTELLLVQMCQLNVSKSEFAAESVN